MSNKTTEAKNRAAADIQITAEQLIRDGAERQNSQRRDFPVRITSKEDAQEYTFMKRRSFENALRNQRQNIGNYLKYATWEESMHEFERARSIYERAIEVDYRNKTIWLRYADMEVKNKFINRARNVLRRAITYLPRLDAFWYRAVGLEEQLENIAGARELFDEWMKFLPNEQAWKTYINFEMRCGTVALARKVYEQYIQIYATESSYLSYAKWEEHQGQKAYARQVFERALRDLTRDDITQRLYIEFGKFEIRCHELERARVIFKYGLDNLEPEKAKELEKEYNSFQKQYGSNEEIDSFIAEKRRKQYEEAIQQNPYDYDIWFDYIRLEEDYGDLQKIRDVYERSIANVPPSQEKKYWRRYIYFWIYYAIFEELIAEDMERARAVYEQCLQLIPHKVFTFAKVWIYYAEFEIRQNHLPQARKILGTAIGMCPKPKLFKAYIDIEKQLMNFDRCRVLYEKYIEYCNYRVDTWIEYTDFEYELGEYERMRAIFEIGISRMVLDKPDLLWKRYITVESEIDEEDGELVRQLYHRLLERTKHPNIYISFAKYEREKSLENGRKILNEGIDYYRDIGDNECRAILLGALLNYEEQTENNEENIQKAQSRQPKRVTKEVETENGMEETYDYEFPDDKVYSELKILENMKHYQEQKMMAKRVKTEEEIDIDDI